MVAQQRSEVARSSVLYAMANWCNLRLVVTGHAKDVARFRRAAGALRGRIDASRSDVFTEEMEYGEGGDLEADGLSRVNGDLRAASYMFQGRNTDHVDHFVEVSRRYPRLAFVLVVSDPNHPDNGSFLIRAGRKRWWALPWRVHLRLFTGFLRECEAVPPGKIDFDNLDHENDTVDMAYWQAAFKGMDVAQARWDKEIVDWLRKLPATPASRRGQRRRGTGAAAHTPRQPNHWTDAIALLLRWWPWR